MTDVLSSPSGVRQQSDQSMRGAQSGGSRASSHTSSSAGRAALAARSRLPTGAGGSGRHPVASAAADHNINNGTVSRTVHNNNNNNLGRDPDTAFREGLDEHVACAFLDDADLSVFLSSGSSALGSPRRSLSTTRATRRQGLVDLHSAAGDGARREGGGVAAAASAASHTRSQSAGRFSVESPGQSENVGRFLAAEVAMAIAGGGGDVDGGASRLPPGMDADEVRFSRRVGSREIHAAAAANSTKTSERSVLQRLLEYGLVD